jgi:lipid-A-disaccharide synthase-like uncharacterized protein
MIPLGRRALPLLLAVGSLCPAVLADTEEPSPPTDDAFPRLLQQAAEARDQGRADQARRLLIQAARQAGRDDFHGLLLDASAAYDEGRHGAARGRLKKAIHEVNPWFWVILGLVAQVLFTGRFLVQWLASERAKRSVVPVSFWYLSIGGSLLLLTYAIWRQDPVFILGQACGSFIYVRNLTFIYRDRAAAAAPAGEDPDD